jgi:hypothetical protein
MPMLVTTCLPIGGACGHQESEVNIRRIRSCVIFLNVA